MGHVPVQTHTSGTELFQGQLCSPSALARSPPSFHKSSPSLTVCQPPAITVQPKPCLPFCSQRVTLLHMLTCSLSFLSVLLQGTQIFFLPHTPFHAPLPSLCHQIPLPSGGCTLIPQNNAGSQSPSLWQMYSYKLAEPIYKALIFIKVNLSLKKCA